jgi:hypothetical protein
LSNVKLLACLACACAAPLLAASAAQASPAFGVAEDMTKYADDGGASLYPRLRALGMTEDRITVRWNPADPTVIPERSFLDRALPAAAKAGVRFVFDVYPVDPKAFTVDAGTRATLFAAYLQKLARTYPEVTDYIVGNEPNESYFWQPQFGSGGEQVSAAAFLRVLAAAYDALKAVDPEIRVIAAGPSSEGNDRTSTSPVRYLRALGLAYRRSGRSMPFMDALSFHVYPQKNTDPASRRYAWPNAGGFDRARIKQAVWDAFAGTAQPTFPEGPATEGNGSLGLVVDEFGWQVEILSRLAGRYHGDENVPTITETEQALYYGELMRAFACDAAVTDAMVFHLVDEPDLNRFQTGLLRIDLSERPSYGAAKVAIASSSSCKWSPMWWHEEDVVGARALFGVADAPATRSVFGISVTAQEEARARAGIFRVGGPNARLQPEDFARSLAASTALDAPLLATSALVKARYKPRLEFRGRLQPGYYVFAVRLAATMNPARSETLVSRVFRVG